MQLVIQRTDPLYKVVISVNVYTKKGDQGMTDLWSGQRVRKNNQYIEALGVIDELTSALGVVRSNVDEKIGRDVLRIQQKLKDIMAVVASEFQQTIDVTEEIQWLEQGIDHNQGLYPPKERFIYPGDDPIAAQLDVARTIARRSERRIVDVLPEQKEHQNIIQYINRLSDYIFVLARMLEFREVVRQSLERSLEEKQEDVSMPKTMTLNFARHIAGTIEAEAKRMGVNVVISIANKDGNSILTQVMDNAFLVSKGMAERKAFTSAALQMPTEELKELVNQGAPFEGLENMIEEKIVTLGGGYPLQHQGITYGAIGVSGSTADNDIYLASYGASKIERKSL